MITLNIAEHPNKNDRNDTAFFVVAAWLYIVIFKIMMNLTMAFFPFIILTGKKIYSVIFSVIIENITP